MPRTMQRGRWAGLGIACVALPLLLVQCLPGDTRPTPGTLHLTVEPSAAVKEGVSTDDGWSVSFERFLIGLGDADVDGSSCADYRGGRYDRLFDLTATGEPQKLSDEYGLGTCDLEIRLRQPSNDALLAEGVTAGDLAFMREGGLDAWVEEESRASVYVRGKAARGGVSKQFEWTFRRRYEISNCARAGDAGITTTIDLRGGADVPFAVVVHGEELFRESADVGAALRFDAIAAADADGDGAVTLEELALAPGPPPSVDGGIVSGDGGAGSLGDLVYGTLLARMIHLSDSEVCVAELDDGGR